MYLRKYRSGDCGEIMGLFYNTVHIVNAGDYTAEQLEAWAPEKMDAVQWDHSLSEHNTIAAVENGMIVGFGDMDSTGYLDRLYVHASFQGRGIATAICDRLEQSYEGPVITHASITARPFFEGRGYRLVRQQTVVRHGVQLTNFVMEKA